MVCSWPIFHNDIASLKKTGKIVHVIQGRLVLDPLRDTRVRDAIKLLNEDDIISMVVKRATYLSSRLEDKVYRMEDIQMIKNTRVLLGVKCPMQSVVSRGAAAVANLTWDSKKVQQLVKIGILDLSGTVQNKLQQC